MLISWLGEKNATFFLPLTVANTASNVFNNIQTQRQPLVAAKKQSQQQQ
jgi:hypothetical protein